MLCESEAQDVVSRKQGQKWSWGAGAASWWGSRTCTVHIMAAPILIELTCLRKHRRMSKYLDPAAQVRDLGEAAVGGRDLSLSLILPLFLHVSPFLPPLHICVCDSISNE